jgi:hypothetical protein
MTRQKIRFIVWGSIALAIAVVVLMYDVYTAPNPGFEKAERYFNRNKELFIPVKKFLAESEHEAISIAPHSGSWRMFVNQGNPPYANIRDEVAIEAVRQLQRKGYISIDKTRGVISFGGQVGSLEFLTGFAYSINGSIPDDSSIQFLTRIKPLTEDGWFYFEANYKEYRIRRNF